MLNLILLFLHSIELAQHPGQKYRTHLSNLSFVILKEKFDVFPNEIDIVVFGRDGENERCKKSLYCCCCYFQDEESIAVAANARLHL
ncbi:hypothetical protein RJT34_10891 [Clitoria ternatea]|uniref:Cyclotide n=1 Tax=Clitoria ternatea TaxID=43366 RepID=A0AAN9JKW4_CLITE